MAITQSEVFDTEMATQTVTIQNDHAGDDLAKPECVEAIEGILRGLEAVKAGPTRPVAEFLAELREKFGFPEKRPEVE
ncbi:MAG: hypothetical protein ACRD82_23965 [Blastocatellia bacterium]